MTSYSMIRFMRGYASHDGFHAIFRIGYWTGFGQILYQKELDNRWDSL